MSDIFDEFRLSFAPAMNEDKKTTKIRLSSRKKSRQRCKNTEDWVENEYGHAYKKPKNGESY